jgi:hypothetical protein
MNGAIAIGIGMFLLLAVALVLAYSHVQQAQRNEMRRVLIEKFGTSQDLGAFLQSPGGRQLMSDLSTGSAAGSVLSSVQKGIVLLAVGFGFAGAGGMTSAPPVVGIGLIIAFSGVGFLVSAGVTYFLSKAMGLMAKRQEN